MFLYIQTRDVGTTYGYKHSLCTFLCHIDSSQGDKHLTDGEKFIFCPQMSCLLEERMKTRTVSSPLPSIGCAARQSAVGGVS